MTTQPETLRLAAELDALLGYRGINADVGKAAAELRRLSIENEALKQAVARLQQHHATAWNRGHTMGMKANEDTARRALDAVKQDAWGNTQLTEALLKAEAHRDALLEACRAMLTFIERHAPRGLQPEPGSPVAMARAAIKAVEEEA